VQGGAFYRTYSYDDGGLANESDSAKVSSLLIDKYLVTVGRFRAFTAALFPPNGGVGWLPGAGWGKHVHLNAGNGLVNSGPSGGYERGWQSADDEAVAPTTANLTLCTTGSVPTSWTDKVGTQEHLPINCVTWWEAYAFCIWDGGFLPSEGEWIYAAAGGSEQRMFPWGSADPGLSSQYAIYNCYYPSGSRSCSGIGDLAPVGTATGGAGLWGHYDLGGELWEWNLDGNANYVSPCEDCAYLDSTAGRAVHGGDFTLGAENLTPPLRYYRSTSASSIRYDDVGFRCAHSP
jgi:formylglycine-generating enzyme required for sulfatase activity